VECERPGDRLRRGLRWGCRSRPCSSSDPLLVDEDELPVEDESPLSSLLSAVRATSQNRGFLWSSLADEPRRSPGTSFRRFSFHGLLFYVDGSFTEAIVAPTTPHCNLECNQLYRRCATANVECECD
jgi:hypothetical protein